MSVGVHSFEIPHAAVKPTRDMVVIRIPMPPSKIGSILTPDVTRDLMAHNVMAGRVVAKGPLAFAMKNSDGTHTIQECEIGDWVLIRPFAGTMMQGGKLMANSGWRYVSSYQDVIGVIPAAAMPDPETLEWEYKEQPAASSPLASDAVPEGVRERVVYKPER